MTMRRLYLLVAILSIPVLIFTACDKTETTEDAAAIPAADEHAGYDHGPAQATSGAFLSGTVVETMNSGGYSYVLLDTGNSRVWLAGPTTEGLEVGTKVHTPDGMEMKNFTAKSLDKTFESIFFVGAILPEGAKMPAGDAHSGMGMGGMGGMGGGASSSTKVDPADVAPVEKAAGGYTVEDIYTKANELGGKTVKIRGTVVKFTGNIMGTNWVHIQDGTGAGETSDLTVTTSDVVAAGDVVVVEGPLSVDKDFGAGYKYHVIVEGASVKK